MRSTGLLLVSLTLASVASARSKSAPPLLPPPSDSTTSYRQVSYYAPEPQAVRSTGRVRESSAQPPMRLGVDLGVLGRYNATSGNILGLKMMWGGRFGARWVLGDGFYLRPQIGYFRRVESAGDASVAQNLFELGAVLQYAVVRLGNVTFLAGAALRGEAQFSRISALNAAELTSIAFGGRAGPAASLNIPVDKSTSIVTDLEVTFGFERPVRAYTGLTAGMLFSLD